MIDIVLPDYDVDPAFLLLAQRDRLAIQHSVREVYLVQIENYGCGHTDALGRCWLAHADYRVGHSSASRNVWV